jgi:hypothetical protein
MILILEQGTWKNALLLAGTLPNVHFLIPLKSKKWHWIHKFFYSVHQVEEENNIESILKTAQSYVEKGLVPCLMLENRPPQKQKSPANSFLDFFKPTTTQMLYVRPGKDPESGKNTLQFEK